MIRALLPLLLLPSLAAAQNDIFANAAGCARLAGQPAGDSAMIFRPGESVEFHESTCPITGFTMVGGGAFLLTLECTGEGETWEAYWMAITTVGDGYTLYPEDQPDLRTDLARCD